MASPYQNSFIQGLNLNEIKVIEEHLKKSSASAEQSKDLKLFMALTSKSDKIFTDRELSELTGSKGSALRVLKSRMFEKATEALTHDAHIRNDQIFNENDIVILKLWKKLLIYRILQRTSRKDNTELALELLDQIINEAKEYETYDILINALIAKKYFYGIRSGIKEFDLISKEIDFYNYCLQSIVFAADCYYKLILHDNFVKSLNEKELEKHILYSIRQMKCDFKKTKSQQINYYLHILQFVKYEREKNYSKAIEYCNELVKVLKKSKIIYRKERMGIALDNLSQFKTFMGDYKNAAKDAKNAQGFYLENSLTFIISTEQEFRAYFYDKEYGKAGKCVNKLLEYSTEDTGEFRKSKFLFYKAYIYFANREHKNALKLLNNSMEIEKDKARWNIALKILSIMINIELKQITTASSLLESLRKYMERTSKNEEIKERDELIVRFLREIEKNGFTYDSSNTIAAKMLKALSEKGKPLSWEHYTPELMPFHEWVSPKDSSGGKKTN